MDYVTWVGFFLSILAILFISRWHLGASLFTASLVLAIFTMGPGEFGSLGLETFTNPGIVMMALAVALIPMIGGYMEYSGQMGSLVSNLRVSRRGFLATVPALLGMLPMPGGALLSAPMVKMGGEGVSSEDKVSLNVWFRHVLYLIYPLSTALIVSTYLAGLTVYGVIPYLFPFFLLASLIGYAAFLRDARGKIQGRGEFSWKGLLVPLGVLMIAPILDFIILNGAKPEVRETALLLAVLVSFSLAFYFARPGLGRHWKIAKKMKPWNFGSIILGMFLFLAVFTSSGVPGLIARLNLSDMALCVGVGFMLGAVTGRIQVPASIIIPIYMGSAGVATMSPWVFAVTYFSIFLGYVVSPVHPCISVSLEYFDVSMRGFMKKIGPPTVVGLVLVMMAALFVM